MTNDHNKFKIKYYANDDLDMVSLDIYSYKISIIVYWTKLTKSDCTASNNSYIIMKNNSSNNNMQLPLETIIVQTLYVNWHYIDMSSVETLKAKMIIYIKNRFFSLIIVLFTPNH